MFIQIIPLFSSVMDRSHHKLRINSGIHHDVLHDFFLHHVVLHESFIQHDVLVTFLTFSNFLVEEN